MAEQSNGYVNIGASFTEFKNFKKNIKCYIGDKDADMFLDYLKGLSESQDGFYFAYVVDEDKYLARNFWADTHSVTFATALVDHENDVSFIWVFKKFLDCMGNKEPQCILTDKDPAIKLGVCSVFKKVRHRYYMWHIMKKLTDKVGLQICKETDFVERICAFVWDTDLEPLEFKEKWSQVISDFELNNNTWLTYMYGKRHKWIRAYFRDLTLGCLLKTTQRSENKNSFFKRFESIDDTLVQFWLHFQSAMEQQRYNQKFLDVASDSALP
ncbi:protein FAR-RED IMPAIRED RESPONSE 1-like [Silene latifolia]|uniref:protein FAR-RED IMPAIRED RESPONSE 1-like n=1 Tax=Silene latifolia TaxID=37657 RepID=UPI003D7896E1